MFTNTIYAVGTLFPQKIREYICPKIDEKKEKVYVVGNGWASYYFVKNLDKLKFEPVIIAPNSNVLNTPKLVNRAVDANAVVEFPNPYAKKILDVVEDINVDNSTLITKSGTTYPYTRVVFAIGSEPNDFGIPGVDAHTLKFKTIADADLLREKINSLYTDSKIYIVGSGVTGIELGTKITSLEGFNGFHGVSIRIIDGLDNILPGYNDKTKQVVREKINLEYPNIELILNSFVKSIELKTDGNKLLKCHNNITNKTSHYHFWYYPYPYPSELRTNFDIIVWTGGVRFKGFGRTRLFHTLNSITPIKPRGLDVEPDFSLKNKNTIYCLGDMVGNAGPPTAQNAKNQGIWLAGYFNSGFDADYIKSYPYEITSKGKMVHLNDKVYLESKYYSGFISNFVSKITEWTE